jgi:Holliday junction DNA helicase RuvB
MALINFTDVVRPQSLDEIIGLDHIKQVLKYDIIGSSKLQQTIPSYIIAGVAGSGKSTVAGVIASLTGGNVLKYLGTELRKDTDVVDIATKVEDGDIVYIEEAHGIGKLSQIVLLEWIENFKLINGGDVGIIDAPKVSFIFPTTNPGKLSKPLRERCRTLYTSYYKLEEIKQILTRAGRKYSLILDEDDDALTLLAQSSRGTPRTALIHRLDMLRKVMVVDDVPYNIETVRNMLRSNSINEWGLESNDMIYCQTLYSKISDNNGRPVAKKIMSQSTGFDDDLVDIIESYLQQINAISVEPGGRFLTSFGCNILDKEPLRLNKNDVAQKGRINLERLRELVVDESVRKKGMKGIAESFGLTYGPDNHILKSALEEIGYTVKRRAGIVPQ